MTSNRELATRSLPSEAPARPDKVTGVEGPPMAAAPDEVSPAWGERPPQPRWLALFETLLVSGIPTQVFVGAALFGVLRMSPRDDEGLSLRFFATLSLIDTLLVAILIRFFLRNTGERPRDVFIGNRKIGREVMLGLLLVPVVLMVVGAV